MDPLTTILTVITSSAKYVIDQVDWSKVWANFTTDGAKAGGGALLCRIKPPDQQQKAIRQSLALFTDEFLKELSAEVDPIEIPPYQDRLRRFLPAAAPHLAAFLRPETTDIDLGLVNRMWTGHHPQTPLPAAFDWTRVAANYARAIRTLVKRDPDLRAQLDIALQEEQAGALRRLAPLDPGFKLPEYRAYLTKKCATLQLSAMHSSAYARRILLWSVFVPQSARAAAPVRDLPRDLIRRLREEGHTSEDEARRLEDGEQLSQLRESFESSPSGPVLASLERERLAVILGDPGSGKTSLLRYLAMQWVAEDRGPFPLLIDLKEYVQDEPQQHRRQGFLKYCESGVATFGLDAAQLERRFASGEAALYLDGLDEVFDPRLRGTVIQEIIAFAARYPQARLAVTSRIIGYEPEPLRNADFTHLTLEDFDDEQVRGFLEKWHEVAEEDPKERHRLQAQLERALRDSRAIRELAGNPLLLTMMAILNRNQDLPRDRVELYREAARVLLHEWDASRLLPVDTFGRQEKEELLRELAGAMQKSGAEGEAAEAGLAGNLISRASLTTLFRNYLAEELRVPDPHTKANDLVRQLTERNFILCFAGADRFSFVHRTFLEYFCASWFVEQVEKKNTLTREELKTQVFGAHWRDETWHEVLRLIAGMVGEKQAEELILYLMAQDGSNDKLANLMLAAGCLSEVRKRSAMQATDDALKERFLQEAIRYDPPSYCAFPFEEASKPGPTRRKAVAFLVFTWRSAATPRWLRKAAETDSDWNVRSAAIQELARGWKHDSDTLPWLKKLVGSNQIDGVRSAAVQELARGWKLDPDTLPLLKDRARSDKNEYVRSAAVQELARGWKLDPETLPLLKDRARSDQHYAVRSAAVRELARGWKLDPDTLPLLKDRARSDQHYAVRIAAIQESTRGGKLDLDTLPLLKDLASSNYNSLVRSAAVQELARGGKLDPDTLPLLKDCARSDQNEFVRRVAVHELARGWKLDPHTLPLLKDRARSDEDNAVRMAAVQELARGWKLDPDTLPLYLAVVRDSPAGYWRSTALNELQTLWPDDPRVQALLAELKTT